MHDYVMFGFSHFFGDIFDCIAADGQGQLTKIVLNVPETPFPGRLSLNERLSRLPYKVSIENFDDWRPRPRLSGAERYVIGFSRKTMKPLVDSLKRLHHIDFATLIHQSATIQAGATLLEGVIVNAAAIIGPWAKIGRHTIVNRGANVGHDCEIGDYCFLSPGATLCSHVKLGENVVVGANATITPDVHVGDNAVIAAGAVVLYDVPADVMVAGVPAVVKKMVGGKC